MVQLILGTVQLGMDYGINNKSGKPDFEKAFEILNYAFNNGICLLDTANAYGDSEEIIGNFIKDTGNDFNIITKLSSCGKIEDLNSFVMNQINNSLERLSKEVIDLYLIHDFNDLIVNNNLIDILSSIKDSGKIKKIGVSLYDPSELEYLILNHSENIDFVQIPFNILDSRWLSNNLLTETKNNGINIFVRSIFLQGLIFMEDEVEMNKIDLSLKFYLKNLKKFAESKHISMSRFAIDYVCSFDEIDGILIGCETVEQLKDNINQFNGEISINDGDKLKIIELTENIPEKIIDPRKWDN